MSNEMSRRELIKAGFGAGALVTLGALPAFAFPHIPAATLIERAIPSSGEKLPVIGIGTAVRYSVDDTALEIAELRKVLEAFPTMGGKIIDTAPGYGRAEAVSGRLIQEIKNRDKYFFASKFSLGRGATDAATVRAQFDESLRRYGTDRMDLLQIWNMSSPELLMPIMNELKAAKRIRYTGVTTSSERQYEGLEALMKAQKLDFIQIDYAIDNREAADRILPLAQERGMAVLINSPFGRRRVFEKVRDKPVPDWAKEIHATTWAQIFLKYIVAHPAVTAAIPGTAQMKYLPDNLAAAQGRLPDPAFRKRIEGYFDSLPA